MLDVKSIVKYPADPLSMNRLEASMKNNEKSSNSMDRITFTARSKLVPWYCKLKQY